MSEFELKIEDTTKGLPTDLRAKLAQVLAEMEKNESTELSNRLSLPKNEALWYIAYKTTL